MPLSPGGYTVNLIATRELDVLDWIRDACQIVIGDGLFYKTERMPLPGSYPAFFTECDVELNNERKLKKYMTVKPLKSLS